MPMRFIVCGSRNWDWDERIRAELDTMPADATLIHGGCPTGADAIADQYWRSLSRLVDVYPAYWSAYGRAAGPLRNQRMINDGKPELVIAFHKNASRGTQDMILRAVRAKVKVKIIDANWKVTNG